MVKDAGAEKRVKLLIAQIAGNDGDRRQAS